MNPLITLKEHRVSNALCKAKLEAKKKYAHPYFLAALQWTGNGL